MSDDSKTEADLVELAAGDPRLWSDWLSVDRVVAIYGLARASVYELKAHGIRWSKAPGIGLRFYRPDIDAHLERHVPALARKMHESFAKIGGR